MALSSKLIYDDFCLAADQLYYEHMEMPTAAKTHDLIGHGSLATHQHYLNRWKELRRKKPDTLPEQLAKKLQEKSQAFSEEIWKALTKTQQEHHQKIQQSAKETIESAQIEAKEAVLAKQKADEALKTLEHQYQLLQQDHTRLAADFSEAEKRNLINEEKNKSLIQQFEAHKAETAQQLKYLKEQDEKNRILFREQLKEQEQKAEQRYTALQKEKNEEKLTTEKAVDKMKAEQKQLETKLYEKQAEIEKGRAEAFHLNGLLDKAKTEKQSYLEETQGLRKDLHEKEHQLSLIKGERQVLQQQLKEYQQKVTVLQEKVLNFEKRKKKSTKE